MLLFFVSFHRNDADDASSSIYETDEDDSDNVNAFSFLVFFFYRFCIPAKGLKQS